jgi:hypothetical protein
VFLAASRRQQINLTFWIFHRSIKTNRTYELTTACHYRAIACSAVASYRVWGKGGNSAVLYLVERLRVTLCQSHQGHQRQRQVCFASGQFWRKVGQGGTSQAFSEATAYLHHQLLTTTS